ncbi:hypothetical protein CI102_13033 [Trichoderma harzianum]|nr:hypothetical protein CI102_13033 [Trichoderma harzianum]
MSSLETEEGIPACCKSIRESMSSCVSASYEYDNLAQQIAEARTRSARQELETQMEYHAVIKAVDSKTGLDAQIELLRLVKSTGWSTVRRAVSKALWEQFPVGDEHAELQAQFEADRRASITLTGSMIGVSNPNALRLPGRQTRRQTRVPAPVVRTPPVAAPPKRDLPELDTLLDTPAPKRIHVETPTAANLLTPTTVNRRSSRLSGRPNVDYSLPSEFSALDEEEEEPEVSIKTPRQEKRTDIINMDYSLNEALTGLGPNEEYDDQDSQYLDDPDIIDLDVAGDIIEEIENDEAKVDPGSGRRAIGDRWIVTIPYVDENGWIRIGSQPKAVGTYRRFAPRGRGSSIIKASIRANFKNTDERLGIPADSVEAEIAAARKAQVDCLEEDQSKYVTRLCDYTGTYLSWVAHPQSISMEAIYPYAMIGTHLGYHSASNMAAISASLNWSKMKNGPMHLPLLATWLNAHDVKNMGFEERKGRWLWVFNAIINCAILNRQAHLTLDHQPQMHQWGRWTPAKQRDILEALRTGTRNASVDGILASLSSSEVYTLRQISDGLPRMEFRKVIEF